MAELNSTQGPTDRKIRLKNLLDKGSAIGKVLFCRFLLQIDLKIYFIQYPLIEILIKE